MNTPTPTMDGIPAQPRLIGGLIEKLMVASKQGKPTPRYSQLRAVYCLDQDCPKETDWLLFQPTAIPLWVIGAMMLTLALVATIKYRKGESFKLLFIGSKLTGIALGIAMMLRASVAQLNNSLVALYAASMFFNYHAGLLAYFKLWNGAMQIVTLFQPPTSAEKRLSYALRFIFRFSPFVLTVLGVALMFHPPSRAHASGMHCIQVALAMVFITSLAIILAFVVRLPAMRGHMDRRNIVSTFISLLLVEMWTLFMFVRSFVGLNNVARTSEIIFWLLNYLPIIVQCLVAMSLGEPFSEKESPVQLGNVAEQIAQPEPELESDTKQAQHLEKGYTMKEASFLENRSYLV
ncbi:hypothetical protein EV178_004269 [Coemansia sp. RSA 1646]|nr:hypothetical protein EV178_004269 [Coemansia sp. RSA 1646]KAJ2211743.1 hypothetical protein EV179_005244 [Coemansia sp. RSA 487]